MGVLLQKVKLHELDLALFKSKARDLSGLPDLHTLARSEDKALWALAFAKDKVGIDYLSSAEAAAVLADIFEVSAEEPAIRMALTRSGDKVHSKDFGRTRKFSIMKAGRVHLHSLNTDSAFMVDPQKPYGALARISDLFARFTGTVKVCDPYLDHKTLQITPMMPDSCQIRFLSNPPKDGQAFGRHLKAYKVEHPNLEIRSIPPGRIHDRYVITMQDMWSIGHSLNAIGSKQTLIVKLGDDIRREVEKSFDAMWAVACSIG